MPICPMCKKQNQDLLKHLRISHDITDPEQYQIQLSNVEKSERNQHEFSDFVSQLKGQKVSGEQYREAVAKWFKEHSEE